MAPVAQLAFMLLPVMLLPPRLAGLAAVPDACQADSEEQVLLQTTTLSARRERVEDVEGVPGEGIASGWTSSILDESEEQAMLQLRSVRRGDVKAVRHTGQPLVGHAGLAGFEEGGYAEGSLPGPAGPKASPLPSGVAPAAPTARAASAGAAAPAPAALAAAAAAAPVASAAPDAASGAAGTAAAGAPAGQGAAGAAGAAGVAGAAGADEVQRAAGGVPERAALAGSMVEPEGSAPTPAGWLGGSLHGGTLVGLQASSPLPALVAVVAWLLMWLAMRTPESMAKPKARAMSVLAGLASRWPSPAHKAEGTEKPKERAAPLRPLPRLCQVGASFVVPISRITNSTAMTLSVDTPAAPAVWPLRAILSRTTQGGPWAKMDLTVDIIDAAGLPPLLSCSPVGDAMHPPDAGAGATGDVLPPWSIEQAAAASTKLSVLKPWLQVRVGGGAVAAVVVRGVEGACAILREDQPAWEVEAFLQGEQGFVLVRKRGQEIGLATRLVSRELGAAPEQNDAEEYLQVDTQPDPSCPESAMLLLCMLAMLVFRPPAHK